MKLSWLDQMEDDFENHRLYFEALTLEHLKESNGNIDDAMESLSKFLEERERQIKDYISEQNKILDDVNTLLEDKIKAKFNVLAANILLAEIQDFYNLTTESPSDKDKFLVHIHAVSNKIDQAIQERFDALKSTVASIEDTTLEIKQIEAKKILSGSATLESSNKLFVRKMLLKNLTADPEFATIAQNLDKLYSEEHKKYHEIVTVCETVVKKSIGNLGKLTAIQSQSLDVGLKFLEKSKENLTNKVRALNENVDSVSIDSQYKIFYEQQLLNLAIEKIESTKQQVTANLANKKSAMAPPKSQLK